MEVATACEKLLLDALKDTTTAWYIAAVCAVLLATTRRWTGSGTLFGKLFVPVWFVKLLLFIPQVLVVLVSMKNAFRIRTFALKEYGMVIHEFDPWFNFRATQYLAKHGWHAFFHWFDYMSWYPLGRPVGTTIYPGLQIISVLIHKVLRWNDAWRMTLNDICCTLPCWGGSASTLFSALIAYEVSGSRTAASCTAVIMAIIPAHIMRSVGGGYDNECIAIPTMLLTFYLWIRSIRNTSSWWLGIAVGLAYGFMVAAWGGFIFVLNLIATHAAVLSIVHFLTNDYCSALHRSYTLFFVIGTAIATRVPPVNTQPFQSLEQLFAFVVFIFMQALYVVDRQRRAARCKPLSGKGFFLLLRTFFVVLCILGAATYLLLPTGYFGPLSSRVRGLFVKHTKTGNPLVDSVAEHQPANANAFLQYLNVAYYGWQLGTAICVLFFLLRGPQYRAASSFMITYSAVVYYFALRMSRLILLTGPVASIASGIVVGWGAEWAVEQLFWYENETETEEETQGKFFAVRWASAAKNFFPQFRHVRLSVAVVVVSLLIGWVPKNYKSFAAHSEEMAHAFSEPHIMMKGRLQNGQTVMIDDYREAYFWLRDKTPQDSRVMAWWDYGYQITGIGNRTSIADGNTWNHEHIATLGKCLTSPVKESHSLVRHLADFVLIWHPDDLGKSPHMARIGNSVYRDICKGDPSCSQFGFYDREQMQPTPMMKASLLYNLAMYQVNPAVKLDTKLFQLVKSTKYGKVKIFKVMNVSAQSKAWIANATNRKCDAPGSWYCVGNYPPAKSIKALLSKRRDFGQLEDFNRKKSDEEYHKSYMERI